MRRDVVQVISLRNSAVSLCEPQRELLVPLRKSARTSLFFSGFFLSLPLQNLVEKFELIATTGKNAKTPLIPSFQSTIVPIIC
jgi:hypothetical protein